MYPPAFSATGEPVCPECGSSLVYVEHSVARREYPVGAIEVDTDPSTGRTWYLPLLGPMEDERDTETLRTRLDCASLDCRWSYSGTSLGDAELP